MHDKCLSLIKMSLANTVFPHHYGNMLKYTYPLVLNGLHDNFLISGNEIYYKGTLPIVKTDNEISVQFDESNLPDPEIFGLLTYNFFISSSTFGDTIKTTITMVDENHNSSFSVNYSEDGYKFDTSDKIIVKLVGNVFPLLKIKRNEIISYEIIMIDGYADQVRLVISYSSELLKFISEQIEDKLKHDNSTILLQSDDSTMSEKTNNMENFYSENNSKKYNNFDQSSKLINDIYNTNKRSDVSKPDIFGNSSILTGIDLDASDLTDMENLKDIVRTAFDIDADSSVDIKKHSKKK